MSRVIGYLSTVYKKQDVKLLYSQLKAAGAIKIYQEEPSDTKRMRPEFDKLMADFKNGDTLVVPSLESVAYTTKHLLQLVDALNDSGINFKVIDCGLDISGLNRNIITLLLRAITDFEQRIVKGRQSEGIEKAKREGRYKGRKPTAFAKAEEVLALSAQGLTRQKIADQLGIGVASVYRILKHNSASRAISVKPVIEKKRAERKPKKLPSQTTEQLSLF